VPDGGRRRRSVGGRWYTWSVLSELRVENLLLIERAELRLGPGLNVLTGETGAGKTVLAHALDLLLGGKPRSGIVRPGAAEAYKRKTNVLTIGDIEEMGIEKAAEVALDLAWKDTDAVYISFDVDSLDCGFVPGTGWPEPGGFLPREALKLLGLVAAEGLCGLEVVEVSPPYDTSDITALVGVRVVVEALGSLVAHGKLGSHKSIIDKPVRY